MRPPVRALAAAVAIAIAGAVPAVLLYTHTLDFGFDYDDYHFARPYAPAEVLAAFHGPWDASQIELPYYRPLTVALYAARFELLGLNSRAYHWASVLGFALAAALAALVAWRFSGRFDAGAFAAGFFALHPSMPYALVSWVTNQMHLLEILVVLSALIWWHGVRARSLAWWIPLWLLAVAAFLVKEDGIMLLPAIVALHWVRRRVCEPALPPQWTFAIGSAALALGLIVLRGHALGDATARAMPDAAQAWSNYLGGLDGVFRLVPADRPWQQAASWFAIALPVAGVACAPRVSAGLRFTILAGGLIAVLFNLPFVYVTKNEQMHAVATGAAIVLGAAAATVVDALGRRLLKAIAVTVLVAGLGAFATVARNISGDFEPFGPIVLSHDRIVSGWAAVPHELREYVESKRQPSAATTIPPNPADALDSVIYGVHPPERSPEGLAYRWMSGTRAEILIRGTAHSITLPLRHEAGAFRELTEARVEVDGTTVDRIRFTDGNWRFSRVALRPATVSPLRRMHRLSLSIDHAWVPAAIIPGSSDGRTLGLQIGSIEVR